MSYTSFRRYFRAAGIAAAFVFVLSGCGGSGAGSGGTGASGTIMGVVLDSAADSAIAGADVTLLSDTSVSTATDSFGFFTLTAPEGLQSLRFVAPGYFVPNVNVIVVAGETVFVEANGSADLTGNRVRFVLYWGEEPEDLDSHLHTPTGVHVYYANDAGGGAILDYDDVDSYGPETITIHDQEAGTYFYDVFNYSGYPEMAGRGAYVEIFDASGFVQRVTIPATGSGLYWRVFTYDGESFTIINEIVDTIPEYWPDDAAN
ncbi:MAG: carboxypeptidase regulatory-like domain-containing protein [Spirochaetaceae bacterium]